MSHIDRIRDAGQPQTFPEPQQVISREAAGDIAAQALAKWEATTPEEARRIASILEKEFPDQAQPDDFWHSQSSIAFRDFFVWGHNHNLGAASAGLEQWAPDTSKLPPKQYAWECCPPACKASRFWI